MRKIEIGKNDGGQRLDRFLEKSLPGLPKSLKYKYIRKKRIKVNGKRAEISTRLKEGDVLELYINDEFFDSEKGKTDFIKAGTDLDVVYEDENIIVCNKPSGLLSHPDDSEYLDTLIMKILRYLYDKGEYRPEEELSFTPALVNRLDRNTGGLVIAAKDAETLRILNEKIRNREIEKHYICETDGVPEPESGELEGYILKDREKNMVSLHKDPVKGGKPVHTVYRVIEKRDGRALVDVNLITGRTHQIRVHFAEMGCPLTGDPKYGHGKKGEHQHLLSYKLVFSFTTDAGKLDYLEGKELALTNFSFRNY